ncbi:MAG: hypothetical protein KUG78_11220 [Kangiellaceae bacterium]|nr:hypothetical protein [Kangiellaceae bacterium]
MKIYIKLASILLALFSINSQQVSAENTKSNCKFDISTTAYIDHNAPVTVGSEIGNVYQTHMDKVHALKKTGNFKNFKITNQSVDLNTNHNNSSIKTVIFRVTIQFDLNYEAVSNIYSQFKKSTINVSTYETKNCD